MLKKMQLYVIVVFKLPQIYGKFVDFVQKQQCTSLQFTLLFVSLDHLLFNLQFVKIKTYWSSAFFFHWIHCTNAMHWKF